MKYTDTLPLAPKKNTSIQGIAVQISRCAHRQHRQCGCRMKQSFRGIVTDLGLLVDRPTPIPSIRALLDIVRDLVPNLRCKPLLLFTYKVSSYKGLIELLDYIASLSNHTHPIVPILVDDNTHKRCLKLLYCERTRCWNWHEKLILYGSHLVWLLASL